MSPLRTAGHALLLSAWLLASTLVASVAAYLIKSFTLEPLLSFRDVRRRIQNDLRYHSNILTNSGLPNEMAAEAQTIMRRLSCDLEVSYDAVGLNRLLCQLGFLPARTEITKASTKLIYLSNAANMAGRELDNDQAVEAIRTALGIRGERA